MAYKAIRNNIVAKKTTELVLHFYKKTTKLVFIWPNMGQKSIKVLTVFLGAQEPISRNKVITVYRLLWSTEILK